MPIHPQTTIAAIYIQPTDPFHAHLTVHFHLIKLVSAIFAPSAPIPCTVFLSSSSASLPPPCSLLETRTAHPPHTTASPAATQTLSLLRASSCPIYVLPIFFSIPAHSYAMALLGPQLHLNPLSFRHQKSHPLNPAAHDTLSQAAVNRQAAARTRRRRRRLVLVAVCTFGRGWSSVIQYF
jgi:hypothetical protein